MALLYLKGVQVQTQTIFNDLKVCTNSALSLKVLNVPEVLKALRVV